MDTTQRAIIEQMSEVLDRQWYGIPNADWQGWRKELDAEHARLPLVTPLTDWYGNHEGECLCVMPIDADDSTFTLQYEIVRIDDDGEPHLLMQWLVTAPCTTYAELEAFIREIHGSYMKLYSKTTQDTAQ